MTSPELNPGRGKTIVSSSRRVSPPIAIASGPAGRSWTFLDALTSIDWVVALV